MPTKFFWSVYAYRLVRWTVSGLFIWAGILKLSDPQAFGVIIRDFGLLPEELVPGVAYLLPGLEVIAGLGLIFDIRGCLSIIAGLLVFFISILGYAILLGLDIDCGCFGPEDPEVRAYSRLRTALVRDLFLAGGVMFLYYWRYVHFRLKGGG